MSEALLLAVDAGEAPIAVFADWCEEQGEPWFAGVRTLAQLDRWPDSDESGWYWRIDLEGRIVQRPSRAILPVDVWRVLYPDLGRGGEGWFVPPLEYRRHQLLDAVRRGAIAFETHEEQ